MHNERAKAFEVFTGTDNTLTPAKEYKIKEEFGTDVLFSPVPAKRHGELPVMRAPLVRPRFPHCSSFSPGSASV